MYKSQQMSVIITLTNWIKVYVFRKSENVSSGVLELHDIVTFEFLIFAIYVKIINQRWAI